MVELLLLLMSNYAALSWFPFQQFCHLVNLSNFQCFASENSHAVIQVSIKSVLIHEIPFLITHIQIKSRMVDVDVDVDGWLLTYSVLFEMPFRNPYSLELGLNYRSYFTIK